MTRIDVNVPPPNSNQTPINFQGIPQHIVTWYPHTTPNIDNYQGIPQHITTYIPSGQGPDTYGAKKRSYQIEPTGLLIGGIIGFIFGGIIFTATGRKVAGAAGERIAYHVAPKR
jgi:hypothetical protein